MYIAFFAGISTLFCFNPDYPYLSLLPGLLMTPGNSAIWVLIPSMTGDAVDYDETLTGRRREGSFQATFSWTFKLSGSIATAISGPLIWLAGYDPGLKGAVQSEDVIFNLRMIVGVLPAVMMAAAIWMISRYPLTNEKIAEIHDELAARRKADAAT